jgi:hypothetical protein
VRGLEQAPPAAGPLLGAAEARADLALLRLVLWYISAVVSKNKLWAAQGNTARGRSVILCTAVLCP